MHARAHTGIGAHFCTHACLLAILPAAATCCRRLPHLLPLLVLRKAGPHAHLCLPLCAALCNRCSACVPQPLPSQPAATGLSAAALPPPSLSAAAARFAQTKTPRCLGTEQTLSNRGDARVLVSSVHEAVSFTRGIKIPIGSNLGWLRWRLRPLVRTLAISCHSLPYTRSKPSTPPERDTHPFQNPWYLSRTPRGV